MKSWRQRHGTSETLDRIVPCLFLVLVTEPWFTAAWLQALSPIYAGYHIAFSFCLCVHTGFPPSGDTIILDEGPP